MRSQIDPTIPANGENLVAQPVRDNFAAAYGEINALQDAVDALEEGGGDAYVLKAGDTMTGQLRLPAGTTPAPALQIGAIADAGLTGVAGGFAAVAGGALRMRWGSEGTSLSAPLSMLHYQISLLGAPTGDFDAVNKNYVDDNFLALDGGTLNAPLTLSGAPTEDLHAAPKSYVDAATRPLSKTLSWLAGADPAGGTFFIADRALTITRITGVVEVPNGGPVSVVVVRAASGVPLASGTAVHTGTFDANGTPGFYLDLSVNVAAVAPGDRLGLTTTGEFTDSVGSISVFVQ